MRTTLFTLLLMAIIACSDPNARNEKGQTPLILAAEAGELVRVVELIGEGADIHARDLCLWTPLLKAAPRAQFTEPSRPEH